MSSASMPKISARGAQPAGSNSVERANRVDEAVDAWLQHLIDLGGRDSLLWYRDLSDGTLDLTRAHPSGLAMLLAGRPTRLSTLIREPDALADCRRRARAIRAKATELAEEHGVRTCWLAVGMASWSMPGAHRPPAAPVLLRGCQLRPRGGVDDDVDIDLAPVAEINPVLRQYMAAEHGVWLDADSLADEAMTADGFDPGPVLRQVAQACRDVPGFRVDPRLVIGSFFSARLPLVTDLAAQRDELGRHDVIAALAGDPAALASLVGPAPPVVGDVDPASEHLVLDADAAQQAAIEAVLAGSHLVVKGPPGTGKSQTITNLIVALAAAGRRTLFVAEKRAAIDTVMARLRAVGLDDLVLHVTGDGTDRLRVARQLAAVLEQAQLSTSSDTTVSSAAAGSASATSVAVSHSGARLLERRERLVGHATSLHLSREPWGVSAYEAQLALARLTARAPAPRSRVRLRGEQLTQLTADRLPHLRERLQDVASLGAFTAAVGDPWFGARLTSSDEAERALAAATDLSQRLLPRLRETVAMVVSDAGMPEPRSLSDVRAALALIGSVRDTTETFSPTVYDTSLADAVAATADARWRAERGVRMGRRQRRRLARSARRLLRPGLPPSDLHAALVVAHQQRQRWQDLAGPGARPRLPGGLAEAEQAYADIAAPIRWLSERLAASRLGGALDDHELDELAIRLSQLSTRATSLSVIPRTTPILDELRDAGLAPLLPDLAARGVSPAAVGAELDLVWWTSLLEHIAVTDPRYRAHDGDQLRSVAADFAAADREHIASGPARVRQILVDRVLDVATKHPGHVAVLRAEAAGDRRHRSLPELVRDCPDVIGAIQPCWAMSPLTVPQVLPPGELFDVVVFDEASQVPPARAVPAISRASRVVIVGDDRQLAPASFVTHAVSDREGQLESATGGESVLDVLAAAVPVVSLSWHYRSRDERLVAFINSRIYGGRLITAPAVARESALVVDQVDGRGTLAPGAAAVESTDAEVTRVVELVLTHLQTRPSESLGVITVGRRHARRVDDALRVALAERPGLAARAAGSGGAERLFVKHLEQVQGDERDAIILSIGYGRTPHGRVLHWFGPLSQDGGERRLTVAVSRARRRMTVVVAFAAEDLDPHRLTTSGSRMLRDYLAYAARGGVVPPEDVTPASSVTRHDPGSGAGSPGQTGAADSSRGAVDPAHRAVGPAKSEVADPPKRGTANSASGGVDWTADRDQQAADPLLADLVHRLTSRGLHVATEVGASSGRVSLAVGRKGEPPVVAVDTDGYSYAAMPNARQRDRLWAEHVERAGWRHVRVWSTDVFRNPESEAARVAAMVNSVVPDVPVSVPANPDPVHPDSTAQDSMVQGSQPEPVGGDLSRTLRADPRSPRASAGDNPGRSGRDQPGGDVSWGDPRARDADHDSWLREQRPPHWSD
ncbi:MAG: AAA domain-containing protein [Angustibacter sp.]